MNRVNAQDASTKKNVKKLSNMASKMSFKKWFSSKSRTELSQSATPTTSASNDLPSWIVYGSAKDLPFDKFIKVATTNDLSHLTVSGKPPQEELEAAWLNIYVEYNEVIDSNFVVQLESSAHTEVLRAKVKLVGAIIDTLMPPYRADDPKSPRMFIYCERLVDSLRKLGFNYKFDPNNPEACMKDIVRVNTRAKSWVLQIRIKDKEKEDRQTRNAVSLDKMFAEMTMALGKYLGYHVKASEYTTYEFAVAFNAMQKAHEHGRLDK